MIKGIQLKVCGLTRVVDADAASSVGADFLGFIFHPDSPRYVDLETFRAMVPNLPKAARVAVVVAPEESALEQLDELGFNFIQIHFPGDQTPFSRLQAWSSKVGRDRLWLAPKIVHEGSFDKAWTDLADTFLWDTYHENGFGGSGKTSNWPGFRKLSESYPEKTWVLAGGLNPQNVVEAIAQTGAKSVDINSGVERMPGIKDSIKLNQIRVALENR